jgi:hypothetical protein
MIWQRCPKTGFASKFTVETAVNDAVACFNDVNIARAKVVNKMGIVPGVWCVTTLQKLDEGKILQADFRTNSGAQQERRKKRRLIVEQENTNCMKERSEYKIIVRKCSIFVFCFVPQT